MHETITVKKRGPGVLHVVLAGVITLGLYFLERWALTHYLTERHYGRLSGGENVFWFILCFLLILLFMEGLYYFTSALMLILSDRENYVAIRKSSLENQRAVEIYRGFRKKSRRIREGNNQVMYLLLATLMMIYSLKQNIEGSTLMLAVVFLVLFMSVNPVAASMMKKARAEINAIFLSQCDAALSYDILELSRQDRKMNHVKMTGIMLQAEYCYFMGDYPEMQRKLAACQGRVPAMLRPVHIYYRGLYALDTGDRDAFYGCVRELDAYAAAKKLPPPQKNLMEQMRMELRVRVDLMDGDPASMIPAISQMIPREKTKPDWMNRTFQLAWLQLKVGDIEQARRNLRLVADGAGTMAIRYRAEELLQETAGR